MKFAMTLSGRRLAIPSRCCDNIRPGLELGHVCIQLLLVFGSHSRRQLPANLEINRPPGLLTCLWISGQLAKFGNVSLVILFNLIGSNIGCRTRLRHESGLQHKCLRIPKLKLDLRSIHRQLTGEARLQLFTFRLEFCQLIFLSLVQGDALCLGGL